MENTEYSIEFECENCKDKTWHKLPVGTSITQFFKDKICENCGCYIIQKWNRKKKQQVNE